MLILHFAVIKYQLSGVDYTFSNTEQSVLARNKNKTCARIYLIKILCSVDRVNSTW